MSPMRSLIILLTILCLFGIAGRMDYQDQIMMELAQTPELPTGVEPDNSRPVGAQLSIGDRVYPGRCFTSTGWAGGHPFPRPFSNK